MTVRFTVSAYCLNYGALLLVDHTKHGWVPPGGKIEPDESPRRALVRELREELGWQQSLDYEFCGSSDIVSPEGFLAYEQHAAGTDILHCNVAFLILSNTRLVTPCSEFRGYRWFESLAPLAERLPFNVQTLAGRALARTRQQKENV